MGAPASAIPIGNRLKDFAAKNNSGRINTGAVSTAKPLAGPTSNGIRLKDGVCALNAELFKFGAEKSDGAPAKVARIGTMT